MSLQEQQRKRAAERLDSRTHDGLLVAKPGAAQGAVRRFRVVTENTNDLDCHFYNADTSEEGAVVVKVAKPKVLRGAVTGLYNDDDEILAASGIAGGTGASGCAWEALTTPPYWTADPP